jgi:hypothetical protein
MSLDEQHSHEPPTRAFARYIGVRYTGAESPNAGLKGLRVYCATADSAACEVTTPSAVKRCWTRQDIAHWLGERLAEGIPTIVGIDHPFSFPLRYFEFHQLPPDWPTFMEDFQRHWLTDAPHTYVDFALECADGKGADRMGSPQWLRLTEQRSRPARSVFQFEGPGSRAKAAHAGIPWLLYLHRQRIPGLHFWPFDGWRIPSGRSAVVEVSAARWRNAWPAQGRSADQQNAYVITTWLREADGSGLLAQCLEPETTEHERIYGEVEGWILGVG